MKRYRHAPVCDAHVRVTLYNVDVNERLVSALPAGRSDISEYNLYTDDDRKSVPNGIITHEHVFVV